VADAVSLVGSAEVPVGEPAYSEKLRRASAAVLSVYSLVEMSARSAFCRFVTACCWISSVFGADSTAISWVTIEAVSMPDERPVKVTLPPKSTIAQTS